MDEDEAAAPARKSKQELQEEEERKLLEARKQVRLHLNLGSPLIYIHCHICMCFPCVLSSYGFL